MSYKPLLQTRYEEVVVPALKEKFGYKNVMEMPRLVKVSLNQGVGAAVNDKKLWSKSTGNIFTQGYF
jgi:large subunit ribosomal protein L5